MQDHFGSHAKDEQVERASLMDSLWVSHKKHLATPHSFFFPAL
jgi:hypothetical protein